MFKPVASLSLLAGLAGLVGCGDDPPTPAQVRAKIASDLAHVLDDSAVGFDAAAEAMPGAGAMNLLDRVLASSDAEVAARVRTQIAARVLVASARQAITPEDPAEESPSAAIVEYLTEEVFTDGNHLGDGVFQIPAELVCTSTQYDDQGNPSEVLDPECAAHIEEAQLRIRVTSDDDEMKFALEVTAEREQPLVLTLEPDAVALTVDLDDAMQSAVALAQIAGEDLPNASLRGQVTGKLALLGAGHPEVSVTVDRAVTIALADDGEALDGPRALRFTTAQADAFAMAVNGTARTGTLSLGVGATTLQVPPLFEDESGEPGDTFALELAGLTAEASYGANQPFTLSNVGLGNGDLVMKHNGAVAQTVSLNADAGRAFSATVTDDVATGISSISVTPKLDVRMTVDHAVLGTTVDVYDVTRVLVSGALEAQAESTTVKVVSGQYAVETNPASYGFSADAGSCVTAEDIYDSTTGSSYVQYTVTACP